MTKPTAGGNKAYNYGYWSGTAEYCRKRKEWVDKLKSCPSEDA